MTVCAFEDDRRRHCAEAALAPLSLAAIAVLATFAWAAVALAATALL